MTMNKTRYWLNAGVNHNAAVFNRSYHTARACLARVVEFNEKGKA